MLGNVKSWHWCIFGLGKQIILTLTQSSTCPCLAIRKGRRQCPGPVWAGRLWEAPAREDPVTNSSDAEASGWFEPAFLCSRERVGVWPWEKAKILKQILEGASQDLCIRKLPWGFFLLVWKTWGSALFLTDCVSPVDFLIRIMRFSS